MKKKAYVKPSAEVVVLKQPALLAGSVAENVGTQNYNWNDVEEE